ncbi:hypothetical protein Pres01_47030 [Metapseudomonas resinovorans]|nr:hypothetical protein Pres01_47030 [Pseudomonas resinovorans]
MRRAHRRFDLAPKLILKSVRAAHPTVQTELKRSGPRGWIRPCKRGGAHLKVSFPDPQKKKAPQVAPSAFRGTAYIVIACL